MPRQRVKDTRAALVEHFRQERFVHQSALFAPDPEKLSAWLSKNEVLEEPEDESGSEPVMLDGDAAGGPAQGRNASDYDEGFREAAE